MARTVTFTISDTGAVTSSTNDAAGTPTLSASDLRAYAETAYAEGLALFQWQEGKAHRYLGTAAMILPACSVALLLPLIRLKETGDPEWGLRAAAFLSVLAFVSVAVACVVCCFVMSTETIPGRIVESPIPPPSGLPAAAAAPAVETEPDPAPGVTNLTTVMMSMPAADFAEYVARELLVAASIASRVNDRRGSLLRGAFFSLMAAVALALVGTSVSIFFW